MLQVPILCKKCKQLIIDKKIPTFYRKIKITFDYKILNEIITAFIIHSKLYNGQKYFKQVAECIIYPEHIQVLYYIIVCKH